MPHDFTYQVHEDNHGYVWIGTDNGLVKFNGKNFTVFNHNHIVDSDFFIDINTYKKDTLVLAVWKSGLHFITRDSIIKPIIINKAFRSKKTQTAQPVDNDIIASNNGIHSVYKRGSNFEFHISQFVFKTSKNGIPKINYNVKSGSNSYNYSTLKVINNTPYFYRGFNKQADKKLFYGLYQYNLKSKELKLSHPFLKNRQINDFGKYSETEYYFTENNTLSIFNDNRIIKTKKIPVNGIIHRYLKTDYCDVFVVNDYDSLNDYIYLYDKNSAVWIKLSDNFSASNSILISDVYKDSQQNIWVTSKADGIYKISKEDNFYTNKILPKNHVFDINTNDSEHIFFLTLKSLASFNKKKKETKNILLPGDASEFNDNLKNTNKINIKYKRKNNTKIKFNGFLFFSDNLNVNKINGIIFKNKTFFIDYKINSKRNYITVDKNVIIYNFIIHLDNELWVSTNNGILVYNLYNGKYKKKIIIDSNNPLLPVYKIVNSPKGVWAIAGSSLYLIKQKSTIKFGEKDGLSSAKINDIILDHKNTLWISHQRGYSIYQNKMFYNFSKEPNFPSSFTSKVKEDNEKNIWIAGNKGVVSINNSRAFKPIHPPKIIVSKKNNNFLIDVVDFSEKNVTKQYKINKSTWKNIKTNIDLSKFEPKKYTLQFRARNPLSNWSYSKIFTHKITQIWYKTIWFYALCLLCCLVLFFLRLKKINDKNKFLRNTIIESKNLQQEITNVRKNIAQDFHDELGNKLAGISILSDLIAKDKEIQNSKSIQKINQIQKESKDLYSNIKDFIWSVEVKSNELKELIVHLTDFGNNLFQFSEISFISKVNIDKNKIDYKLPNYWNRQITLIFKEAMTNTLKHSNANFTSLYFSITENNTLKIELKDNGIGYTIENLKHKYGILSIKKRAEKIKSTLIIESKKGTTITFIGKIKH
ncbi:histidine kinase [Aquimarina algiphila]|uniref:Signal transduction histidine kinase subgroup 3 dimerisation and phosphoacceptor domain-containing protein n=1 Tax=Aquimarina algiphila TaxID=2047982 RepID=A0A554VAA0_9FLAO|nr:histidine kinase [Aquimarina algiphila]TSE02884.1 hypothetical protein FOF46_30335 [Aquimarina algiphila]